MLKYRLIFGPIMIAVLVGLFFLDNHLQQVNWVLSAGKAIGLSHGLPPGLGVLGLFMLLIILGSRELGQVFAAKQMSTTSGILVLGGFLGLGLMYILPTWAAQNALPIFATAIGFVFLFALVVHCWPKQQTEGSVRAGGAAVFAMVYVGILPGFWLLVRHDFTSWVVVGLIMITKSCDIGAYFTGRAIGRHKLIPWLSPGKTWEGLVGGVLFSGLVAMGLVWASNHWQIQTAVTLTRNGFVSVQQQYVPWMAFVVGAILGVLGQFGDLVASLFKRDAGIKDSGSSVPGFGGILDVADSPIVVAPAAYWLMHLLKLASASWTLPGV